MPPSIRPLLWTAALAALLLVACSDAHPPVLPTSMMPLAVGNRWTYLEIHGVGSTADTTNSALEITQRARVGAYEYFLSNTDLAFAWVPSGLSVAIVDGAEFDGFEALLGYPASERNYHYTSERTSSIDLHIVVTEDLIDTPAGSYNALTYRILRGDNGAFLFSMSFAKGIGMVRQVNGVGTTWLLSAVELV